MGKDRDAIWGHVEVLKGGGWKCKFCGKEYSGHPSRIKAHLGNVGGRGITPCKKVDDATKVESALALSRDSSSVEHTSERGSESFCQSKRIRLGDTGSYGGDVADVAGTSSNNIGEMGTNSGIMCAPSMGPSNFEPFKGLDNLLPDCLNCIDPDWLFGESTCPSPFMTDNNNNSSNPFRDGAESASSRPYNGTLDTASSQLDGMNSFFPNTSGLFSMGNLGTSHLAHNIKGDGIAMTNAVSTEEMVKRDLFMWSSDDRKTDEDESSGSDSDIFPVDDPLSLANRHCNKNYDRLEVLQILKRGGTLVLSGGVEGFVCICSLSPPPAQDVEKLVFDGCPKVKSLLGCGPTTTLHLKILKEIVVKNCVEFEEIIAEDLALKDNQPFLRLRSINISECPRMRILMVPLLLPHLQYLTTIHVHNCNSFKTILASTPDMASLSPMTLPRLKSLEIVGCPNIEFLISSEWLHALCNIHDITVANCERMEGVIGQSGSEQTESNVASSKSHLSKLRNLKLSNLPGLKSISHGDVGCNGLKLVDISKCPKLNRMPLLEGLVSPDPSLKIKIDKDLWNSFEWSKHDTRTCLQSYVLFLLIPKLCFAFLLYFLNSDI